MKQGRLKHSITYLLLVVFISMKMAGLHVLSHTDDKDHALHCVVCDQAITHNFTPALTPDSQEFVIGETTAYLVKKEISKSYGFIISNTLAANQLFSRPPPSLL
ncbi:hypothetical protein [Confluentibacter sediminis]|uniref:hypothetical protein n=1 Tax=Confluentibacter sediminis TaxID=2219045 RepID=UPI000DADF9B4|nr:hypothetical protein [Confluentibacter sediminis]